MATSTIKWNEGDGNIVATYEGSGDGPISLTTTPNEGIDREQEITIQTTDKNKSVNVLVKQEGLREIFATTDGYILADGGTFNVLKNKEESGLFPATIIYSYINENIPNYTIAKYFIDTYPDMVVGNSGEYTPITEDVTIQGSNHCDGKVVGVAKWVDGESLLFYTENSISKWYALRVFVDYGTLPNGGTAEFFTD